MNLYLYKVEDDYIEAPSLLLAIQAWRAHNTTYSPRHEGDEPDSVTLLQVGGVIRFELPEEEPRRDEL